MKDLLCHQFQDRVNEYLVRHRSVLDVMAKLQEANTRINRAITKAVTVCGCVRVEAGKQAVPEDTSLHQMRDYMSTHLSGQLCEHCHEIIEAELGTAFFYMAAVCNVFTLDMYDVLLKEHKKLQALGMFNFS